MVSNAYAGHAKKLEFDFLWSTEDKPTDSIDGNAAPRGVAPVQPSSIVHQVTLP
jgi:hypothetical protein